MPLYICNAVRGVIPKAAMGKIAADLTDIHCEIAGTPRRLVHVFFLEDAPELPIGGKSVFLFGSIRPGLAHTRKVELANRMKASIVVHAGVPPKDIVAVTAELPAGWVMDGCDNLPEPGGCVPSTAAHKTPTR